MAIFRSIEDALCARLLAAAYPHVIFVNEMSMPPLVVTVGATLDIGDIYLWYEDISIPFFSDCSGSFSTTC